MIDYDLFNKIIQDGKRVPNLETSIMVDAQCAYMYALHVLQTRWTEAEPFILQDLDWVNYYANDVIHGRWPEAEKEILRKQDAIAACCYAIDVVQGRWPEAEELISKSEEQQETYLDCFFPNTLVVNKSEAGPGFWRRHELDGYFAPELESHSKVSMLDFLDGV